MISGCAAYWVDLNPVVIGDDEMNRIQTEVAVDQIRHVVTEMYGLLSVPSPAPEPRENTEPGKSG